MKNYNVIEDSQLFIPLTGQDSTINLQKASFASKNEGRSPLACQDAHKSNTGDVQPFERSVSEPYLSLKPTSITFYNKHDGNSKRDVLDSALDVSKALMPNSTESGRNLSNKSKKSLKNSINWLVVLAKNKYFLTKGGKKVKFKVNFITLTLSALQAHTDRTIKKALLNQLFTEARRKYGLKNFVWRAEAQECGSLHFHIVSDCYIPHDWLRSTWNRLQEKLGYISRYSAKMSSMSFSDYKVMRLKSHKSQHELTDDVIRKAYDRGVSCGWTNPNSVDIHKVEGINNVGAYVAKYCAKIDSVSVTDEYGERCNDKYVKMAYRNGLRRFDLKERKIDGRKWGRSESVSALKGVSVPLHLKPAVFDEMEFIIENSDLTIYDDFYTVFCLDFSKWKDHCPTLRILFYSYAKEKGYVPSESPISVLLN